jgi:hypothetical protein
MPGGAMSPGRLLQCYRRRFSEMSEALLYRTRAEQCRAEAEAATLDNVRERCLRAEAAWIAMAERGERGDAMRAALELAKATAAAE